MDSKKYVLKNLKNLKKIRYKKKHGFKQFGKFFYI
jgi:hypothetical protein